MKRLVFIITTDSVVLILYTCHMNTRINILRGGMRMNFFEDELMKEAVREVLHQQKASTTMLQRRFHIGYNRARRLIEHMEAVGIISGKNGYEARKIIMDEDEIYQKFLDI